LATDWYFPLERTLEEDAAAAQYRDRYGDYIVAFLSDHGMFRHWVRKWGLTGCVQFIHEIQVATRMPVLLTGCAWDRPFAAQVAGITDAINLAGSTDIDRFFGLLRNARGMVGWCGGNTIKSTYFRVPTLIGWSRFFSDPRFYRNACPPDSWDRWYKAFVVEQTNPKQAARMFVQLMESASMVQR
jgi:hypothetical protein